MIGVIEPGAEAAAAVDGPVGVIGTLATIQSGAYEDAIRRRRPEAVIHSLACPLLVPFAEEGWMDDPITDAVCRRYLNQIPFEVRTVVMACTHYPLLLPSLARTRPGTDWLDSGEYTARAVDLMLQGSLGYRTASARGSLTILLTDASSRLLEVGERFLSEPLESWPWWSCRKVRLFHRRHPRLKFHLEGKASASGANFALEETVRSRPSCRSLTLHARLPARRCAGAQERPAPAGGAGLPGGQRRLPKGWRGWG